MTTTTPDLAKHIGRNARKLRLDAGATLDQIALAARFYGLSWNSGNVGHLESGRGAPRLDTLYAVALALRDVIGRPVTLADLLAGDDPIQINDDLAVPASAVRAAVSGQPVTGETEKLRRLGTVMEKATRKALAAALLDEFREADARACRDIGVTRERGATMMARLWGRTFTEERDGRAGPDANAQRRGQISRALKTELAKGK